MTSSLVMYSQVRLSPPPKSTDGTARLWRCRRTWRTGSTANRTAGIPEPLPCWPGTWTVSSRERRRPTVGAWWWRRRRTLSLWDRGRVTIALSLCGPGSGTGSWCVSHQTPEQERATTPRSRSTSSVSLRWVPEGCKCSRVFSVDAVVKVLSHSSPLLCLPVQPEILRVNAHYSETSDPGLSLVLFALVRSNPPATITFVDQSGQPVANTSDFLILDSRSYPWLTNHSLRVALSSLSGNVSLNASNSLGTAQSNLTLTGQWWYKATAER